MSATTSLIYTISLSRWRSEDSSKIITTIWKDLTTMRGYLQKSPTVILMNHLLKISRLVLSIDLIWTKKQLSSNFLWQNNARNTKEWFKGVIAWWITNKNRYMKEDHPKCLASLQTQGPVSNFFGAKDFENLASVQKN